MIEKKNPKKDLERKRPTFLLLGLVLALGLSILVINWKTYEKVDANANLGELNIEVEDEEETSVIQERKTPPPPPPPPPPPVVVVVDDKVEIEDEVEFQDAETDEEEEIEVIEEVEEEDTDEIFEFHVIEDLPVFPGCEKKSKAERKDCMTLGMMKHVKKQFKYPKKAKQMEVQETIIVEFVIGKDGKVSQTKVLRGKNKELKAAAQKWIKSLPKMTPAKQRGKPVNMKYRIPVKFRLR